MTGRALNSAGQAPAQISHETYHMDGMPNTSDITFSIYGQFSNQESLNLEFGSNEFLNEGGGLS